MPSATWTRAASRSGATGAVVALAGALFLVACGEPRPNLLVVTIDTLRVDHVGAYGDERGLTPHIDALAARGLVHDNAFTTMPTTGPAHVSLFTGLHPSEHGARRNGDPLSPTHASREAGVLLRRAGYATAAFVSTPLMIRPDVGLRGFEVYDAPTGVLRHGQDAVAAALAWLDAEKRRPVFLWVHLYDPHAPYGTPDEKRRSFPVDPGTYGFVDGERYAEPAARREMEERYARGVHNADAALGTLVEGVHERLAPPPLVLFSADHGESFGEHLAERGFAYDHGKYLDPETVRIPLVLAGPGVAPGRSPGTVSIRDLYGTLLAAAGVADAAADAAADAEGRRDLRRPSDAARIVRIERRIFAAPPPRSIRTHAAAATDGSALVVVGEDGSVTGGAPDRAALLAAARQGLPRGAEAPARPLDPETREALRQLGYAE